MPQHGAATGTVELHYPRGSDQAVAGDLDLGSNGWFRIADSAAVRVFNITEAAGPIVTISIEAADTVFQLNQRSGAATTARAIYGRDVTGRDELFWYDGTSEVQITTAGGIAGNTLDEAYDQGGAHLGRQINVDSGFPVQMTAGTTDTALELTGSIDITQTAFFIGGGAHGVLGTQTVLLGHDTAGIGLRATGLGHNADVDVNDATAVGHFSIVSGVRGVALGRAAQAGIDTVVAGYNAVITSSDGVGIGADVTGGLNCISIGSGAGATHNNCMAFGRDSGSSGTNQVAWGSASYQYSNWWGPAGPQATSSPDEWLIAGTPGSSSAGASIDIQAGDSAGTDIPGATLELQAGACTGAGTAGEIRLLTARPAGTGTTVRSRSVRLQIQGNEANYNTEAETDGGWHFATGSYSQSTATTAETAWTLPTAIPTDCTILVRAMVTASYDAAGTAVSAAYDDFYAHYESDGGTVSLVNGGTPSFSSEDNAAYVCTMDTDGTNIRLRVTSPVADPTLWVFKLDWIMATTPP